MTSADSKKGFSLIEILITIGIFAILIGVLLPAIQLVRESARRYHCSNNMRQVSIALHSFEGCFARLPPTLSVEKDSELLHWQAQLLPFLEQGALKANIDEKLKKNFHVYDMFEERTTSLSAFQCLSNPDIGLMLQPQIGTDFAFTDYCGVAGIEADGRTGVFVSSYWLPGTQFSDISDGLSNTVCLGERPPSHWGHGYGAWIGSQNPLAATIGVYETSRSLGGNEDLSIFDTVKGYGTDSRGTPNNWTHHWSFHPHGALFSSCDGSIHFLAYSISPAILSAMATRSQGETISQLD